MEELLTNYSMSEIAMFIVTLALALKGTVTFFDWCRDRVKKAYDVNYCERKEEERAESNERYNAQRVESMDKAIGKMSTLIDMLIESDKESNRAYIVDKHHSFVYSQGWIDDYSLDCLEKRFAVYEREHGNSYIEGLMIEIRELPKQPPVDLVSKYEVTGETVRRSKELKSVREV